MREAKIAPRRAVDPARPARAYQSGGAPRAAPGGRLASGYRPASMPTDDTDETLMTAFAQGRANGIDGFGAIDRAFMEVFELDDHEVTQKAI